MTSMNPEAKKKRNTSNTVRMPGLMYQPASSPRRKKWGMNVVLSSREQRHLPPKLCTVERLSCGATVTRACQSVETSSSVRSHTQLSGWVILACQFVLIKAPIGYGEPPARARNDSMGGGELRILGSITSPNGNGLCGEMDSNSSGRRRWRWPNAGISRDNDGANESVEKTTTDVHTRGLCNTRATKDHQSKAF